MKKKPYSVFKKIKMENKHNTSEISIAAQRYAREGNYWLNQLSGQLLKSTFPYDFSKTGPGTQQQESYEEITFPFPAQWHSRLMKLSKGYDYTLHMIFTAAVTVLLDKYTENRDIIIGTPIYRQEGESRFINTVLAIRTRLTGQMSYKEVLLQVRKNILEAVEYQNYPLKSLLANLDLPVSHREFPLFDVLVLLDRIHDRKYISHLPVNIIFYFKRGDENIQGVLAYNPSCYTAAAAERIKNHFLKVQEAMILDVDGQINKSDLLNEKEKKQLLFDFNNTATPYPGEKTIPQLFALQVEKNRHRLALEYEDKKLTYRELSAQAHQLASGLKEKSLGPDTIVGIMVERSLEMMIAIMGILKAGGAYMPIDPQYPEKRIDYMLKDSGVRFLVTTTSLSGKLSIINCQLLIVNEKPSNRRRLNNPPQETNSINNYQLTINNLQLKGDNLAYILYTSGSTGGPKAAMVKQNNLHNLILGLKQRIYRQYGPGLKVALVAPYFFDASVKQIFGALLQGHCLSIVPENTRIDGRRLLEYYAAFCIDVSDGTPTHLRLLLETCPGNRFPFSVKHFIIGGEDLPRKLSEDFFNRFDGNCPTIINIYGVTECAVDSTSLELTRENIAAYDTRSQSCPIGKPMANSVVYILNRENRLQPIGIAGELCIAGQGVGRGYLNNPELTAEKFDHDLQDLHDYHDGNYRSHRSNTSYISHLSYYRTGDLAQWLADGNIEFIGRIDHQVKIRGYRLELGEIRSRLLKLPGIKDAAVLINTGKHHDKSLCAYIVPGPEGDLSPDILRKHLSQFMPDYMVPVHFVRLDKLPLTPNGKIDRKALPAVETKVKGVYTAPRDSVEEKLTRTWSELLDIEHKKISIDANFFQLGGHSLKATIMSARVHKHFNVEIPLIEVFKTPTIRGLSRLIKKSRPQIYAPIPLAEEKEYYPLSPAMKRLYIEQQLNPGNVNYNVTASLWLEGQLDRKRLEQSFKKITQRHQTLRTAFVLIDDQPVQKIHHDVDIDFQYYDLTRVKTTPGEPGKNETIEIDEILEHFVHSFDLGTAPLLKPGLIKINETRHVLLVDVHHMVCDGTSVGIMAKEFMALYKGEKLLPLPIQYKDYSQWKTGPQRRTLREKQEKYWLDRFRQELTLLNLPLDYPRPAVKSSRGLAITLSLDIEETKKIKNLALEQNISLYMLLVAVYNVFLAKLSGIEDIVLGTPSAGRNHNSLEPLIGMFVNTLVLRNYPRGNKKFNDFLKEVKKTTLEVFENQEYNFADLVQHVVTDRDMSRSPIADVFFALQNMYLPDLYIPGLTMKHYEYKRKVARYDLSFIFFDSGPRLWLYVEYCTELFKEETIQRFISLFRKIAAGVINNPQQKIKQIQFISKEEKHRLLYEFNHTRSPYPQNKTIHELFAKQVEQTPDNTAIAGAHETHEKHQEEYNRSHRSYRSHNTYLSYKELNEKSNRLAYYLRSKGAQPGIIVGIMAEPTLETIAALLAIIKVGGAYLPIDPDFPADRIDYMLKDSGAKILLTGQEIKGTSIHHSTHLPIHPSSPSGLAYILYTSGTTGRPKGVMIQHQNVIRLVKNPNYIDFSPGDRLLLTGTFSFDITTFEIWWPLLNGLTLFLPDRGIIMNPEKLENFLAKNKISILHLIPQLFNQLAAESPGIFSGLKYFLLGGDLVHPHYVNKLRNIHPHMKILHMYGPTENTTFSTFHPVDRDYKTVIPIGKPISNSTVYIIDKYHNLVPIGVPGELIVGGDGVARGYLNNPQLTSEKFDHDRYHRYHRSHRSYRSYILYHTGDLARWLPDGTIEFLGRIDQQVKIRGMRIEVGEIESRLVKHEKIKQALVTVKGQDLNNNHDGYLCAYIVPREATIVEDRELREYLSLYLPPHMIPVHFAVLECIPLTVSGKPDKKALPEPGPKPGQDHEYISPRDAWEEQLEGIWSRVLNITPIGIDDNFFKLGGHSLKAALITARIHRLFHVELPLMVFFNNPTIRQSAAYIKKAGQQEPVTIEPAEKRDRYPLSSAQKRMYYLHCLAPADLTYHIPAGLELQGKIHLQFLEEIFNRLQQRHESLRTCFLLVKGEPVQRIHEKAAIKIAYYDMESEFIRPFDLSRPPLIRAGIIRLEEKKHIFMLDMHHIISDGTSLQILIDEFLTLYGSSKKKSLPPMHIHYRDYCLWQSSHHQREMIKKQEHYWLNRFQGDIPVLEIPIDYPRPAIKSNKGTYVHFEIVPQTAEKLRALAIKQDATMFMVILTIFSILMYKLTQQEDIILGTITMGRRQTDLEKIIGMFVNTLPLRNCPGGEKSFDEFLKETRNSTLDAFENQDYQFEDLVEKLTVKRDPGRNPLFDVVFVFGKLDTLDDPQPVSSTGLKAKPYGTGNTGAKFDILFTGTDTGRQLAFSFGYCTDLFKKETIERFIKYFKEIVSAVEENESIQLKDIFISHHLVTAESDVYRDQESDFKF